MKQWDKPFLGIVAISLAAIVCVIFLTDRGTMENDAIQSLSVARNILRGNGIATDVVYYPRHLQQNRVPAFQTTFPPGHPLLTALIAKLTGWDVERSALMLCSLSFAVITPLLFVMLRDASGKPVVSFLLALFWLSLAECWISVAILNTDIVFIALTVVSAMCLYLGERANWDKKNASLDWVWCVLSGVFAGLAFAERYAGLFLIAAGGATLGLEFLKQRTRAAFARVIGFSVPAGLVVAALFYRNFTLVGSMTGGNDQGIGNSVEVLARELYYVLVTLTGVNFRSLSDGEPAALCAAAGVVVLLLFLVMRPFGLRLDVRQLLKKRKRFVVFAFAYSALTLAALFYLELTSTSVLRARLLVALIPFVMIAGGRMARAVDIAPGRKRTVGIVGLSLVLLGIVFGQRHVAPIEYFPRVGIITKMRAALQNLTHEDESVLELLRSNSSHAHPILSNDAHVLSESLDRPVIGLASPHYVSTTWPEDDIRSLAEKFDVAYVVDVKTSGEAIDFFNSLHDGVKCDWLEPVVRSGDVNVYRVVK